MRGEVGLQLRNDGSGLVQFRASRVAGYRGPVSLLSNEIDLAPQGGLSALGDSAIQCRFEVHSFPRFLESVELCLQVFGAPLLSRKLFVQAGRLFFSSFAVLNQLIPLA